MIPRTLVPLKLRPVSPDEAKTHGHRLETYMDDRTVVPSGLSDAPPLDGRTNIPAHLPLGVLVDRTLVPRGMPAKPIERFEPVHESAVSIAVLDSRVVVPAYVEPADAEEQLEFEHAPEMTDQLREVIEPDIFMTGDANLLMESKDKRDPKSDLLTRVMSVLVHIGLIIFLIFAPKIFPAHVPTDQEINLAKQQLRWIYTPPELPKTAPPPSPKLHITPKTLERISPKIEQPVIPAPAPAAPIKPPAELPEAPKPQAVIPRPQQPAPQTPAPSQLQPVEPIKPNPQTHLNLHLNDDSPGKQIEDQIQDAIRHGSNRGGVYPGGPSGPGVRGPGMGEGFQILSDTQGVDFSSYIQRLLATLKRNWDAVMPESAMMGDRGVTATIFKIAPDGSVIPPDPTLERTSGKEPLDNAAMSAIHASNPFEPLPPQFHGPYLELRIWFVYNIPLDQLPGYR